MKTNNKQPTAYIICGFIGAGKTTFAKKLEKQTGAFRITKDEWLIDLVGHDPKIEGFKKYNEKICRLSHKLACEFIKRGIDVILDEGFWAEQQRQDIREKMEKAGAKVILYYVNCPMALMWERVVERNKNLTPDSFKISKQMFYGYAKYWQPPEVGEDYVLAPVFNTGS